jgi:hypothetical protein
LLAVEEQRANQNDIGGGAGSKYFLDPGVFLKEIIDITKVVLLGY